MFNQLLKRLQRKPTQAPPPAADVVHPNTPTIINVTDSDFADTVVASDKLAVVDFWAEWCQPCQLMSAYVEFLAQEYGDRILIAAIDVDEHPQTAERYTIMGLPTLLLVKNGAEVDRIVGVEEYQLIKTRVEQWLNA
jgi:thioredoxin 1